MFYRIALPHLPVSDIVVDKWKRYVPDTSPDTMSGIMSILSIRMKSSPGNAMHIIVASLNSKFRPSMPKTTPNDTPINVRVVSRLPSRKTFI